MALLILEEEEICMKTLNGRYVFLSASFPSGDRGSVMYSRTTPQQERLRSQFD